MTLSLDLDIVETVDASIIDNVVEIEGEYTYIYDIIYLYKDQNEKIYRLKIENTEMKNGNTFFIIDNSINLSGNVNADIITGKQTLFERIFVKAGKG